MLEKPDLPDGKILACLQGQYALPIVDISFLPLGADRNTAVYRAVAEDEASYFVKLRRGVFDEISVALPKFLSDRGIGHIIVPLPTKTGQLWASLDGFKLILYPFVEGRNGYDVPLSDRHWVDLGIALKGIHTTFVPPGLAGSIRQETYCSHGRETIRAFLERIADEAYDDPVTAELAAFLQVKRDEILDLVSRAERLARALQVRSLESVLCHSDIHAGNLLIGQSVCPGPLACAPVALIATSVVLLSIISSHHPSDVECHPAGCQRRQRCSEARYL